MANRRFEMYHYRQVIHRMRMGQSDRAIAKSRLMGRLKCAQLRQVAQQNGWLADVPLSEDQQLEKIFKIPKETNPTRQSLSHAHENQIKQWIDQGIWGTTIYRVLVDRPSCPCSYANPACISPLAYCRAFSVTS